MPRKIRELEAELKHAGFIIEPGKGSHRVWKKGSVRVTMSGKSGADAHHYQEKDVKQALLKAKESN